MSETNPPSVDTTTDPLQAGVSAMATDAVQALDAATQTADAIAGEIHGAAKAVEAQAPLVDAPAATEAAGMEAAIPHADEPPPGESAVTPIQSFPVSSEIHRLLAIEVPVIVQLGIRRMTVQEVMRFAVGAIIEFSKSAEEEMELLANNMTIGKGQAVKVGENFGIKISSIKTVKEMIKKLGGA